MRYYYLCICRFTAYTVGNMQKIQILYRADDMEGGETSGELAQLLFGRGPICKTSFPP